VRRRDQGDARAADDLLDFLYFAPELSENRNLLRRLAIGLLHQPHRWMYDVDSMTVKLREVGFVNIAACSYRKGRCPGVEQLDTRPESFFLEAAVPAR
jgi:hypothetical protein